MWILEPHSIKYIPGRYQLYTPIEAMSTHLQINNQVFNPETIDHIFQSCLRQSGCNIKTVPTHFGHWLILA